MSKPRTKKSVALVLSVGTLLTGSALDWTGVARAASLAPPVVNGTVDVSTVAQLEYIDTHQTQAIASGSSVTYMDASIALSPGTYNLSGDNWIPLGSPATPFSGSFDGQGAVISGLTLAVSSTSSGAVGLFGVEEGDIANLTLDDVQVRSQASSAVSLGDLAGEVIGGAIENIALQQSTGSASVSGALDWGGLVGTLEGGMIAQVTGSVDMTAVAQSSVVGEFPVPAVGGLVGLQERGTTITGANLEVTLSGQGTIGDLHVGGLVGEQEAGAVIEDSHTGGRVAVSMGQVAGGIVAVQSGGGTINVSNSDASVTGGDMNGGLVGMQSSGGVVENSWAQGTVSASTALDDTRGVTNGGLVGEQWRGGVVANAYAEGPVLGSGGFVIDGGLVGAMWGGGHPYVEDSFATGPVASGTYVGGLVGDEQDGLVSGSFALGNVTGANSSASYGDGGLVGYLFSGTLMQSYAMGTVTGKAAYAAGGVVGSFYGGVVSGVYETGSVTGSHWIGGLVGAFNGGSSTIDGATYLESAAPTAVGSGSAGVESHVTSATLSGMAMPFTDATSPFSPWMTSPTWSQASAIQNGLPYLPEDAVVTLTAPSAIAAEGDSVPMTVNVIYDTLTTSGLTPVAVSGLSLSLHASTGTWADATATSAASPLTIDWTAPATPELASLSASLSGGMMAGMDLTVASAPPASSSTSGTTDVPFVPPTFLPETVMVDGVKGVVIANDGYNPPDAVAWGSSVGYVEERAAVLAGASFNGEGLDSSYLSAILSGRGVGLQHHVSAVQQGQFAALYQKLGIIPTWTASNVSLGAGVAALQQAGAPPLAIENYLVQIGGWTWPVAQAWEASQAHFGS
ncbi:MAG: hypothetical protein OWU84_04040 [Firmicutes bacterium]|nr:hypothetical protein [Bacillota bacterium]